LNPLTAEKSRRKWLEMKIKEAEGEEKKLLE